MTVHGKIRIVKAFRGKTLKKNKNKMSHKTVMCSKNVKTLLKPVSKIHLGTHEGTLDSKFAVDQWTETFVKLDKVSPETYKHNININNKKKTNIAKTHSVKCYREAWLTLMDTHVQAGFDDVSGQWARSENAPPPEELCWRQKKTKKKLYSLKRVLIVTLVTT